MIEWTTITTAIGVALSGEKDSGEKLMMDCWNAAGPTDHAMRCILAHYLADTQAVLDKEVHWDEVALEEQQFLTDDELAPLGIVSAHGLLPSLHLNLADDYHRQGRMQPAREHLIQGQAHLQTLGDDGYGRMIRVGLSHLAQRIAATEHVE